jgi:hypothetical protein
MRIAESKDWSVEPNPIGRVPDLARLASMLKLIIRSPEPEIAKYLGVSPREVQALVEFAIDRLSVASRSLRCELLIKYGCRMPSRADLNRARLPLRSSSHDGRGALEST